MNGRTTGKAWAARFRDHEDVFTAAVVAVEVISTALFVDASSRVGATKAIGKGHIGTAFRELGWDGAFFVILILALTAHAMIHRSALRATRESHSAVVHKLLEIAIRAVIFPEDWGTLQVRAFCHWYNSRSNKLVPLAWCMSHRQDDEDEPIPVDEMTDQGEYVFAIGEAFRTCRVVARDLPPQRPAGEHERKVWPHIRFVAACPIRNPHDRTQALGTVSLDCDLGALSVIRQNERGLSDILFGLSDAVGELLTGIGV